jgi:hypothetical protein
MQRAPTPLARPQNKPPPALQQSGKRQRNATQQVGLPHSRRQPSKKPPGRNRPGWML